MEEPVKYRLYVFKKRNKQEKDSFKEKQTRRLAFYKFMSDTTVESSRDFKICNNSYSVSNIGAFAVVE